MDIGIYGIGWFSDNGCGQIASGRPRSFAPGETFPTLPREALFPRPIRNFGRLDRVSRITLAAVSLALQDAGIDSSPLNKQAIGIVGTNSEGSLITDLDYFLDYVDNGRKLSRANLFIYTLPSSPLGEAAIHFGLTGPLLYTMDGDGSAVSALRLAAGFITDGGAPMMLAGRTEGDRALYFLLGDEGARPVCTLDEAVAILADGFDVAAMVGNFTRLRNG